MFNFLASQHRELPESRPCDEDKEEVKLKSSRCATSMELPMAMRSAIHGRGLFCKRNIEAGEMVIEYAGNVIRSVLTDMREKYYDSKGILAVTCSALTTLMWWMPQCTAMQHASSTTPEGGLSPTLGINNSSMLFSTCV
ncbi:histone-lysine N-methyltransferase 2B-like [Brachyhypopomus gauderio]|uniref:histone-lysine N-methyltransferase 2B-like n=1 Tax=Brachyhypopomus gauderio TaxID=698409 RepID=UPI0040425F1D